MHFRSARRLIFSDILQQLFSIAGEGMHLGDIDNAACQALHSEM